MCQSRLSKAPAVKSGFLYSRVRQICIIFRHFSDKDLKDPFESVHAFSFAGEIDDAELGLPPEPVLPTPVPRHRE